MFCYFFSLSSVEFRRSVAFWVFVFDLDLLRSYSAFNVWRIFRTVLFIGCQLFRKKLYVWLSFFFSSSHFFYRLRSSLLCLQKIINNSIRVLSITWHVSSCHIHFFLMDYRCEFSRWSLVFFFHLSPCPSLDTFWIENQSHK